MKLTAAGWRDWSEALRQARGQLEPGAQPKVIAEAFAQTLTARPIFCDLLAQASLNLERNVSIDSFRSFKLVTLEEVAAIRTELERLLGLTEMQSVDVIATAASSPAPSGKWRPQARRSSPSTAPTPAYPTR